MQVGNDPETCLRHRIGAALQLATATIARLPTPRGDAAIARKCEAMLPRQRRA